MRDGAGSAAPSSGRPVGVQTRCSYFICGTPRGGTTFLAEALLRTGLAGKPKEYFNAADVRLWSARWDTTGGADYLAQALEQTSSPNGVFGSKVYVENLDRMEGMI